MTDKPNVACSDALMGIFGHQRSKNPVEIINGIPHDLQPNGTYRRRAETAKYEANVAKARKDAPEAKRSGNEWEREYELLLRATYPKAIITPQPPKITLAYRCTYTPDFKVEVDGRIEYHEVKGFKRDDAMAKLKVAAQLLQPVQFYIATKDNGQWLIRQVPTIDRKRFESLLASNR